MSRRVNYTDADGRTRVVLVPDDAPSDHAKFGVEVGPPFISFPQLPKEVNVAIQNELHARGLITFEDVRTRLPEVRSAVIVALGPLVESIVELYREHTT